LPCWLGPTVPMFTFGLKTFSDCLNKIASFPIKTR
jgi:hypothetical protein